jgi:hypothetical protein
MTNLAKATPMTFAQDSPAPNAISGAKVKAKARTKARVKEKANPKEKIKAREREKEAKAKAKGGRITKAKVEGLIPKVTAKGVATSAFPPYHGSKAPLSQVNASSAKRLVTERRNAKLA